MLKRILLYAGLTLVILSFLAIMSLGRLTRYEGLHQLDEALIELQQAIKDENWVLAKKLSDRFSKEWNEMLGIVQFGIEVEEQKELEEQVIRLKAAIRYQDQLQAETERSLIVNLLNNLGP